MPFPFFVLYYFAFLNLFFGFLCFVHMCTYLGIYRSQVRNSPILSSSFGFYYLGCLILYFRTFFDCASLIFLMYLLFLFGITFVGFFAKIIYQIFILRLFDGFNCLVIFNTNYYFACSVKDIF